jgi:hypothetical protein
MKTLITWIGFNEDFEKNRENNKIRFKEHGFTANIHRDIYAVQKFERHIILSTTDNSNSISRELEEKKNMLLKGINKYFPGQTVEIRDVAIDKKDLQNFGVIESALRSFLMEFEPTDKITIVAGTGPTAVSMAWSSLFLALKGRFELFLLQLAEYTPGGEKSALVPIEPYVDNWLDEQLRTFHIEKEIPSDIFRDEVVNKEYDRAAAVALAPDLNVLILGETGCGKDKMAEFILEHSPLKNNSYKAINCASLPDELLYSELFGHIKGAYTGAINDRKGLFEECQGGTLFMDEIGDISSFMQQSLLRAIENWEIKRSGTNEIIKIKPIRIIAATNHNLYQKCKEGKFRFDLYYRLCTVEIELEPYRSRTLKERKEVIRYFLSRLEKKWGKTLKLDASARKQIENYSFPGNFREIYNTLNGLFGVGNDVIKAIDLPKRFTINNEEIDEDADIVLKHHCERVYKKYNFKLSETCRALGYSNQTQLKKKFEEWGILNLSN